MERPPETLELKNKAVKTLFEVTAYYLREIFGASQIPNDNIMADPEGLALFDETGEAVELALKEIKKDPHLKLEEALQILLPRGVTIENLEPHGVRLVIGKIRPFGKAFIFIIPAGCIGKDHLHVNTAGHRRLFVEVSMPLGEGKFADVITSREGRPVLPRPVGISVYPDGSVHRFLRQMETAACAVIEMSEPRPLE